MPVRLRPAAVAAAQCRCACPSVLDVVTVLPRASEVDRFLGCNRINGLRMVTRTGWIPSQRLDT